MGAGAEVNKIITILENIRSWQILLLCVLLSELFTSIMSIIFRGRITLDYLITGGVVSFFIAGFLIYIIYYYREIGIKNEALLEELEEREKIEGKLQESEEKFRAITESTMDGIIVMDGDGAIAYVNPAALKILGYKKDEIRGKKVHEVLVCDEARGEYHKRLPKFKKTGKCKVVGKALEVYTTRKDGKRDN